MREIKFRVWDEMGQLWLDDFSITESGILLLHGSENYYMATEEDGVEAILMQYTGLKDKNGVEIAESDVISMFGDSQRSEVFYEDGAFWAWARESGEQKHEEKTILCNLVGISEVIGNAYENPELLK